MTVEYANESDLCEAIALRALVLDNFIQEKINLYKATHNTRPKYLKLPVLLIEYLNYLRDDDGYYLWRDLLISFIDGDFIYDIEVF